MANETITINDHGLGKRLANPNVKKAAEKAMQAAVLMVSDEGSQYPPKPAGSTYTRTGTLGRSVTGKVESLSNEVQGVVGSRVVYAPFVIGDRQRSFHGSHGWVKLEDVALNQLDDINKLFEKAAESVAEFLENG